ncbi:NADP-dependent oxidoreductase domain-containing protein [Plasmodiophora brassicae]|uniref:NADP-dependent oxidoreductase domain-containing protein n=2 Tax=Plasmodiophora brassicae TaxID=37360 RepID=A0A3P3XYS3_PLABS|nr:unnamed protein product [Plasmodiophora brassicae]
MVQRVQLGRGGPMVPAMGLGAMGFSSSYGGRPSEADALRTLQHAVDIGCTLIDTADVYGPHTNEILVGKLLATRTRSDIFVCTKFGIEKVVPAYAVNGSPEYVNAACAASLQRLGVDQIDLYYLHRVDPKVPIEKTVAAMAELVQQGKVKHIGLSEPSAATIRRAHAVHPITAVQVEYSPWTTDIERNGIMDTCKELGIAIVAYSPLGRGFLTGTISSPTDLEEKDWRRMNPRFAEEAMKKNMELVDALKSLASKKNVTPAQLTLAWVIAQGCIPIPGTTKASRLDENFAALNVEITASDEKAIRDIIAKFPVVGPRYPEAMMKAVNI